MATKPLELQSLKWPFVGLAVLLALCTGWAVYDEVFPRRPWKGYQRDFFQLEEKHLKADLARAEKRLEQADAKAKREAVRKGDTDMAITDWWADYPDADNFLYPLFYSGSFGPGGNYAFYADPGTDSLILRARRTTDDTARTALYARIDERVYRAAPWLYLWFPTDLWARRPELTGWDLPVIFNGQRWTLARVAPR